MQRFAERRLSPAGKAVILFVLAALTAYAQISTATLSGLITDPSQARIPSATVKVINEETGVVLAGTSNQQGEYAIPLLPPGHYRVNATANGFRNYSRSGIVLEIGRVVQLDLSMELGPSTETISVVAETPLLESDSSMVSQLIENKTIVDMPINGQRVADLAALVGNTTVVQSGINYPRLQTAGGRADQQSWLMDGVNAGNILLDNPQTNFNPPVEAMQEFRILQSNYSAEYGNTTSGVVSFSTKSGTNEFHGTLYEFFRNDQLDAQNFFAVTKPPLRWNTFGTAVGGPIKKNRTFFFITPEWGEERIGVPRVFTVPTALQKSGDFSKTVTAAGALVRIYDPASTRPSPTNPNQMTRDLFAGNVIPASRFDKVGNNIAQLYPTPNQAGSNLAGANNFSGNSVNSQDNATVTAKIDHMFSDNDRISGRLAWYHFPQLITPVYPVAPTDPVAFQHISTNASLMVEEIHNFSPRIVNDLRFNWGPRTYENDSYGLDQGWPAKLGLTGASPRAFPRVTAGGFSPLGPAAQGAFQNPLNDEHLVDHISWFRGTHSLKLGGELRMNRGVSTTLNNMSGTIGLTPNETALPGTANTGNALASLLLGLADSGSFAIADSLDERTKYIAGFVQDDWRVSRKLTFNLGLRWEAGTPRTDANNRQNGFDGSAINPVSNTPGVVTFAGLNGAPRTEYNGDYNNFGPRIGLAWKPFRGDKTVIRSGFGISYGPAALNASANGFGVNGSYTTPDNGITPAFRLSSGFPAATSPVLGPSYGAVAVGQAPSFAPAFYAWNRVNGYSEQWTFNLQRNLGWRTLLDAGYMGVVGHHLPGPNTSINQVLPQLMGPGNSQAKRPYPQFGNVNVLSPTWGNSTYHALNIKFEKRFSHGLNFLANYTYSKFIDDIASGYEVGSPAAGFQNYYYRRAEKSLAGNDVRNAFAWSSVYEIPVGDRRRYLSKGWPAKVVGGWNLGMIVTLRQGSPFGLVTQTNNTNAFTSGPQRVNIIGDLSLASGQQTIRRWFNTNAVAAPLAYTFGSAGRTVLTGPGLENINLSLLKNVRFLERFNFQVRAEAFNLFNHPNFGDPGNALGSPDFGVINSAMDGRTLQLGLKLQF